MAKKGKKDKKAESSEDAEEEEYEIEYIVDKRKVKGKVEYLIKWKNYSHADDSWEPKDNLDCTKIIEDFEKQEKEKESKSKNDNDKRKSTRNTEKEKLMTTIKKKISDQVEQQKIKLPIKVKE